MATLSAPHWLALPKAAPALYARYGRWLPMLANVLLILLIAKLAANLLWSLVPTPAAAAWQPAPPAGSGTKFGDRIDLGAIASANLFGDYRAPATPGATDISALPDTQLSLILLGIFANERDAKLSLALIGAQGGDEKPYRVGEDLSRGVTLQAIFQDRVILNRNGKLETLRLDKDAPGSPLIASTSAATVPAGSEASASLAGIRSSLLSDPSKVSDYIRVQPVNGGNGLTGYRIYPGKDRAVFNNAGLHPGDIVTSINGTPLTDPSKALQLLSDLSQTNQLNLIIERNGQPQNVSVNLNQ
jgi:general secretion pathway protein C